MRLAIAMYEDCCFDSEPVDFCPACHGAGRYYCQFTDDFIDCSVCGGECYIPVRYYQQIKNQLERQNPEENE